MTCYACNYELTQSTATYFAGLKSCMVIIKNVPCLECKRCGEVFTVIPLRNVWMKSSLRLKSL